MKILYFCIKCIWQQELLATLNFKILHKKKTKNKQDQVILEVYTVLMYIKLNCMQYIVFPV